MSRNMENCVEFISGDLTCTASFTNQKHINRMKKLYEKNKEEFSYLVENADGSICAKFPLSWLKITPPTKREMTEEEKELLRQRLAEVRRNH